MTDGPGRPRRETVLPAVPALGGLYAAGARASLRARLSPAGRAAAGRPAPALPDVAHVVRGVTADADHLTAYQHLLGESATDTLPPGFVHVLAFPVAMSVMTAPGFPLPLLGMVHLANRVEQRRPVRLGDRLDVRAWAQDLHPHPRGTSVRLVAEVEVDGETVWTGVSTYLAKGVAAGVGAEGTGMGGTGTDGTGTDGTGTDGTGTDGTDPRPLPTARWRLPADTGRRYAAVSGDRNPLHLSVATARALGQPRPLAHGMHTAARALAQVGPARGDALVWTATFGSPVRLPATVDVAVARAGDGWTVTGTGRGGRHHLTVGVAPLVGT
ncbi:MaoC/PaaZ C-terminal domain-containing protein [Cellulomonas endophytica]|uniref:MaoC/PaaZ C-terminal domain-containing protein n=1 Tax=Cellulomonas endophytica TaxID=2494735 RepID=UPI0010114E49|nr:MaoC/PaaZ C-terminal domain-containing protein [Cellulomonas endophytica]